MADWDYQHAYPGGKMVAVKGYPRPLYPPDAKGYAPSEDGPDVEAYKRTVSRAGRWTWKAFDQAYSNAFAHGASGDVKDSGIAGVQRQQNLESTGYLGKATINTLRRIRIPEGLPHAGEMAMDARSVELINAAWQIYKGNPSPPQTQTKTSAKARLEKAQAEIGYKENPANSNRNKYGEWYNMDGVPWCAIFCTWSDQLSGSPSVSFVRGQRYSYVPYVVNDARLGMYGLAITSDPQPGDLVCYDWSWDGEFDHIGIFENWVNETQFEAVEGNTSTSDNSNGGQVMRRSRNRGEQNTVFVKVKEPA